jgi:hypothetical protein
VQVDGTWLGFVRIDEFPRSPIPTHIANPVNARVGEYTLLGYAIDEPIARGVTLNMHTFWRADAPPTRDGVLFLHTDRDDCRPTCPQDDNPPERGQRSTLSYRAGEGVDQIHKIIFPPNAPAGEYKLYAGIYNKQGLARWPAQQNGQPAKDDLVYLGSVTLPELALPVPTLTPPTPLSPSLRFKVYAPTLNK